MAEKLNKVVINSQSAISRSKPSTIKDRLQAELLKGPSTKEQFGQGVRAAAELVTGKPFTKLESLRDRSLRELSAAADIEQRDIDNRLKNDALRTKLIANASASSEKAKIKQQGVDERDFKKWAFASDGWGRGGTRVRKQMERRRRMEISNQQLSSFLDGTLIPTKQAAMDVSANISAILQDGSPTLTLIEGTAFNPVKGRLNNIMQQFTGDPKAFYTPELIQEVKKGLEVIKNVSDAEFEENQVRLFNAHGRLFDRNDDLLNNAIENLKSKGMQFNIDENNRVVRTPKIQQDRVSVVSPDGQEGDIPTEQLEEALAQGFQRVQ